MKFVKVMDKFVEIHRDDYNLHKIMLYLEKNISDTEYKNYCIYSKANKMRKFSECDLKTIEKKLGEIIFEECVKYEE